MTKNTCIGCLLCVLVCLLVCAVTLFVSSGCTPLVRHMGGSEYTAHVDTEDAAHLAAIDKCGDGDYELWNDECARVLGSWKFRCYDE